MCLICNFQVETVLKTHPAVENICAFGDSYRNFIVAVVVTSKPYMYKVAKKLEIAVDYKQLLDDVNIKQLILKELISHGKKNGLEKIEIPKDIALVTDEWTPESGLITSSFKVKRKQIQNHYQNVIDRMYLEGLKG